MPETALSFEFSRSGGPGGQHANTSDTRVRVVLDVAAAMFDTPVAALITGSLGPRPSSTCSSGRSQLQNRHRAVESLLELLDNALRQDPERVATRPTAASVQRRLDDKHRDAQRKRSRQDLDW